MLINTIMYNLDMLPHGHMSRYVLTQIVSVLDVTPIERQLPVVQAFLQTEEYQTYLEDAEVCVATITRNVVNV